MSTTRCDYVVLGARLDYDELRTATDGDPDEAYEKYEVPHEDNPSVPEITAPDRFAVISDGMSGEYVVIGRILAKAPQIGDGFQMTDCLGAPDTPTVKEVEAKIAAEFPFLNPADVHVTILAFSHWH